MPAITYRFLAGLPMPDRLITPTQLALFSRSPEIGAWWEESGLHQIEQLAGFINEPVAHAGAAGPRLGGAEGIGLVVLLLEALPMAELVLPLDHDAGHGWAMGNGHGAQHQLRAARPSRSSCEPRAY